MPKSIFTADEDESAGAAAARALPRQLRESNMRYGKSIATGVDDMDPEVRKVAIEFLRSWLPERAKCVYRALIAEDPESWRAQPHFAGGIIVEHALRGNGLTEKALGVEDLELIWAELLERAVLEDASGSESELPPQPRPS